MRKFALQLFFIFGIIVNALANGTPIPPIQGSHIIDQAQILDATTRDILERTIQAHEDSTSNQIMVLTIPKLIDETIEQYAVRAYSQYRLGAEGRDNGVLLIVSYEDRKIRIEVGYGLEGALNDALCGRIIRNDISPEFKQGNYNKGVLNGVHSIISAIQGEYKADPSSGGEFDAADALILIGFIVIIIVLVSLASGKNGGGGGGWYSGGYRGGYYGGGWSSGGGGWSGGRGWSGGGGGFSGGGGASGGW